MIYELLYTSVPKGLKPGSKGYCTVLTTEGIPSALLERLESYCGYRHLFDPGSGKNPDVFAHRVLNLAGNTWHILSRVADAGFDYSGRSNLIGHFMAISQDELKGISAGPASLMMSPGFFRKELAGDPRRVSESETSERLGNVIDKPQKAVTWKIVAGDAGWAGKLVQATEVTSDSIPLVYPLGTNALKLIDEAASILPRDKQWEITFNTFFTKSGEECRWRCFCADVPEANPFKGTEFDLVDLKRRGLKPVDSAYVAAAREGTKMAGPVAVGMSVPVAMSHTQTKTNLEKSLEASQSLADKRKAKKEGEDFLAVVNKDIKKTSVKPANQDLEVLPRQAGSLPPPVKRDLNFDLLNDVINNEKKSHNRKSQSRDPYKTPFFVTAALLVIVVLIFAGNEIIRSKPNTAVVETTKGDTKKADPISDKSAVVGIPKNDARNSEPLRDNPKKGLVRKPEDKKPDGNPSAKEETNEKKKTETAKTQPKSAGDSAATKKDETPKDPNTILITEKDLLVLGDQTRVVLLEKLVREKKDGIDKNKPLKLSIKTDKVLIPTDFKLNEYFTTIEDELRLKAKRISNNELEITISEKIVNLDMKTDVKKIIDLSMVYGVVKIGEKNIAIQFLEPIELIMEKKPIGKPPILGLTTIFPNIDNQPNLKPNKDEYTSSQFEFNCPSKETDGYGKARLDHLKEMSRNQSTRSNKFKSSHRFYESGALVDQLVIYNHREPKKQFQGYFDSQSQAKGIKTVKKLLPKAFVKIDDLFNSNEDSNTNKLFKIQKYIDLVIPLMFNKDTYQMYPVAQVSLNISKNNKKVSISLSNGDCICYLNFINNEWMNGFKNNNLSKAYLMHVGEPTKYKTGGDGKSMVDDDEGNIASAIKHFDPQLNYNNKLIELLENPPEIIVYLVPVDEKQVNVELVVSRYKPSK